MTAKKIDLFETKPVSEAVPALVIPTMAGQLTVVLYNLADTFFIGQMNDHVQVASMIVVVPAFFLLMGFSGIFGSGGASLISRSLGERNYEKARLTASFCILGGLLLALAYSILIFVFQTPVLYLLGANEVTFGPAEKYLFWTTVIGSVPTVMNPLLSHLVRAEGAAKQAGFGVTLGCLLNVVLDPILMFPLKMGLVGAAVATLISNCIAVIYFLVYLYRVRETTVVKAWWGKNPFRKDIVAEVLTVGTPGMLVALSAVISNIVLTHVLTSFSTQALAGMGIAKKIDQFAFNMAQGISMGILPLVGYCYAAGLRTRIRQSIRYTLILGIVLEMILLIVLFVFSRQILDLFIDDPVTEQWGHETLRIICLVGPSTFVNFLIVNIMQAVGKKAVPIFLSILRKGLLDIPLMLILKGPFGVHGVAWATPLAEYIGLVISLILVMPLIREFMKPDKPRSETLPAG